MEGNGVGVSNGERGGTSVTEEQLNKINKNFFKKGSFLRTKGQRKLCPVEGLLWAIRVFRSLVQGSHSGGRG